MNLRSTGTKFTAKTLRLLPFKFMKRISEILSAASIILLMTGCDQAPKIDLPGETSETNSTSSASSAQSEEQGEDQSESQNERPVCPENISVPVEYEPFNGLPKAEKALGDVNCKDFRPSLLCYGDGNTFFMWNGTVYKHNGETTEPLFERNAYNLNYNDGMLYFIENDSYDLSGINQVHIEGILYRYDLNKNEFEALTESPVSLPVVSSGETFYIDYAAAGASELPTGIFRLNENGTSERLYDGMKYIAYGEYRLKYDWSGEEKVYFSNDETALLLENIHPYWDCVDGDYYYYCSTIDNSLNRISVLTGEITTLPSYEPYYTDPLFDDNENKFLCGDYTVLNDEIYFIDDYSALRKYDEGSDDCIQINCKYAFRYLYADDKNIYGVGCEREEESIEHTYHFIKLMLSGSTAEGEILA